MRKIFVLAALAVLPVLAGASENEVAKDTCYWKFPGSTALKYTQSFYSDNWYKGGFNNQSLLAQLTQDANYAKDRITVDNRLEAKLGYYTEKNDEGNTVYKTNEDLLRLTSKFGMKAVKSWYYSAQIQAYTQFMNVYDNDVLKSKFLAPLYGTASIGMDYKPVLEDGKLTLSVLLAPIAYNFRYVSDSSLGPNYGIEPGLDFKQAFGSSAEVNWKWNIWKELTWTGKAQYFTNYSYNEVNIENTLDYAFTKFLAIQLFFHWRLDDSVAADPKLGYNQLKEFLTLNLTFNW